MPGITDPSSPLLLILLPFARGSGTEGPLSRSCEVSLARLAPAVEDSAGDSARGGGRALLVLGRGGDIGIGGGDNGISEGRSGRSERGDELTVLLVTVQTRRHDAYCSAFVHPRSPVPALPVVPEPLPR